MKKKLILLSLALISCACVALGVTACSTDDDGNVTIHYHEMTAYAAKDATCTEAGNIAYWYCEGCGKYFSDYGATTEISYSDTILTALGHDYETTFKWTSTENVWSATATRVCANDSSDTETVNCVLTEDTSKTVAATCTENGSVTYTATATFSDNSTETETKTYTLTATGHSYSTEWTTDGTYHWHEATCTDTDTVSEKAAHDFAYDSDSDSYICETCGYKLTGNVVDNYTDTLTLGDNYLYFASESSLIVGTYYADSSYWVNFTATADGKYTFTVPEDCKVMININYGGLDNGDNYTLGAGDNDKYSVSVIANKNDVISIYYIYLADDTDSFTSYIVDLNISYKEVVIGSEDQPYALSTSDSKEVTLAAGEKYYFDVTASNYLIQVYVSNSNLKLYLDGSEVSLVTDSNNNYCYYLYAAYGTTYSFYIENTSAESVTDTIYCTTYSTTLSEGTNTLTITSAMLNSGYISYSISVDKNTAYTMTLGTGTDDANVAVKSGRSDTSTIYLGKDASDESYVFGNSSSTKTSMAYFYIQYTGTESSITVVLNIVEYDEDTSGSSVEAKNTKIEDLNTSTECTVNYYNFYTVSSYETIVLEYKATSSATYTLALSGNSSWSNLTNYSASYISVTLNDGSTSSTLTGVRGVYVFDLTNETEYTITIKLSGQTVNFGLYATLTTSYTYSLTVSDSAQSVNGGNVYTFIAAADGDYTFTAASGSDIYIVDGNTINKELWSTGLTETLTLSKGDVLYLYCYYDDAEDSITITSTTSSGSEDDDSYTFGTTLTLSGETAEVKVTISEAGTYVVTFTLPEDSGTSYYSFSTDLDFTYTIGETTYSYDDWSSLLTNDDNGCYLTLTISEACEITFNFDLYQSADYTYYVVINAATAD